MYYQSVTGTILNSSIKCIDLSIKDTVAENRRYNLHSAVRLAVHDKVGLISFRISSAIFWLCLPQDSE